MLTRFRPTLIQVAGITLIFVGMALTLKKPKDKIPQLKEQSIEDDARVL